MVGHDDGCVEVEFCAVALEAALHDGVASFMGERRRSQFAESDE